MMEAKKINPVFDDLNNPETILSHVEQLQKDLGIEQENKGLFKVKTANQWIEQAKTSPIPLMLFGELWHDSELCILFADTNLGKSILAVQIADSISKGKTIAGFKLEAKKQTVLYFDFELSAKQFEIRYSIKNEAKKVFEQHYSFDTNFKRFIASLIQGIFFPSETAFKIRPPVLYSKNKTTQNLIENNDKEMEKIVNELKTLKVKRDQNALKKEDSLRIDYLFNQYQKLKNGH